MSIGQFSLRSRFTGSVAVDVARHVKSTTPSTVVWSKKTSLTVWGCWVLTHSLEGFFVCFTGTDDDSECCMSSAKRHSQLSLRRTPLGMSLCRSS